MENASKALIIAGSILVSIVIITLGVMIVSNVTDTINQNSNLSAEEVEAQNSKIKGYAGIKQGSQVKTLLDRVATVNRTELDCSKWITVKTGEAPASGVKACTDADNTAVLNSVKAAQDDVKAGYTYKITFGYDDASGLIVEVYYDKQNK